MHSRAITIVASLLAIAACGSEPAQVTDADYLADLEAICADTTATLEALPQPPEEIPLISMIWIPPIPWPGKYLTKVLYLLN